MRPHDIVAPVRTMGNFAVAYRGPPTEPPPAKNEGHKASVITAYLDRISDARTTRVICGLCDWPGITGTVLEARAAALEHRQQAHPETFKRKRRPPAGSGLKPRPQPKPMWQQSAEDQQAARKRGNKASGAARRRL